MLKSKIKLDKFKKALFALEAIYLKPMQEDRSNVDATIQRFEFTFELTWKFLKDYFLERGMDLNFPKEIFQQAFAVKLIDYEEKWLAMLNDRNLTSHTYNEKLANEIYFRIQTYVPMFRSLIDVIDTISETEN